MALNLLTTLKSQAWADTKLSHLTALKPIERELASFLLSCKVEGLSMATIKNYNYMVGRFIDFCRQENLAGTKDIKPDHVRCFLLQLQQFNKPVSVMDYYKSLGRFFNWLVEERVIKESPMRNIKPPRVPTEIVKPFSDEEIRNILLLCSGGSFVDLRNRAIVMLFLDTGVRLAEMAGLELDRIDFNRETVRVMGKGNKERIVPIGKKAQKELLKYLLSRDDDLPWVWLTQDGKRLTICGLQTVIKKLCKRAGVKEGKSGPHTFRHTAAIHFLRNGGSEFTLQLLLGHTTLKMTRRYVSTLGPDDVIRVHKKASPADNFRTD